TREPAPPRPETKGSERGAELQRPYRDTILTHLSSGVLSFDGRQQLRTYNAAAGTIRGVDLAAASGKPVDWLGQTHPHLAPLTETIGRAMRAGQREWGSEVTLVVDGAGRRTLMLRGTLLPSLKGRYGGCVVVFDDATDP